MKNRVVLCMCTIVFMSFFIAPDEGVSQDFELPRLSPKASVSQTIGVTDVKITYCRPGVKGRVIWGQLVPYNDVWRTGANEATQISFSNDVEINGQKLPKGEYGLFTIPTETTWTIIFNKISNQWGSFNYNQEEDALRVTVIPKKADASKERMEFSFTNLTDDSADVVLSWEKLRVPFTIKTNVSQQVITSAQRAIRWQIPYQAANYLLQKNMDFEQGLEWVKVSQAIEKNYFNTSLEARFLATIGKKKEAVKTMEQALAMGKKMERPPSNLAEMEEILNDWKK